MVQNTYFSWNFIRPKDSFKGFLIIEVIGLHFIRLKLDGFNEYSFKIDVIEALTRAIIDVQNYFCQQELASHFGKTSYPPFYMPRSSSSLDSVG